VREGVHREVCGDEVNATVGKEHAECGTCQGEHDRFGEELAQDAATAGTYGGAHGELMLARDAAGQHEDGDIGTADEQEQEYGAEEREERALKVAEDLLVKSHDSCLRSLGKVGGILLGITVDEGLQLGDEARVSCARLEFDERQHVIVRIRFEVAG